jgi:hypothetical protein
LHVQQVVQLRVMLSLLSRTLRLPFFEVLLYSSGVHQGCNCVHMLMLLLYCRLLV